MTYRNQIESKGYKPRLLHERSFLTFEFPEPQEKIKRVYLPILENCELSESQKSNLAEYSLLGRSGSIYAYLGAKSRTINLTFKITLQHVIETMGTEGISERFKQIFSKSTDEKERFFSGKVKKGEEGEKVENLINKNFAQAHYNYYNSFLPKFSLGEELNTVLRKKFSFKPSPYEDTESSFSEISQKSKFVVEDENFDIHFKTINLILWWINVIRSSVKNNSSNTAYGCPIVRITHGPTYNNIPCIVENYSIKINDQVGYDVYTLLPKQFEISLTLLENRTGDFGLFETGDRILGDNNAGWESTFFDGNMDPYNGIISLEP